LLINNQLVIEREVCSIKLEEVFGSYFASSDILGQAAKPKLAILVLARWYQKLVLCFFFIYIYIYIDTLARWYQKHVLW